MRPLIGLAAALVALLGVACAEADRRPAPAGPPAQTVRADGLALTAIGGRWPGFPPDLERYYVAIEAVIASDRAEAVPLRLGDFTLLDASGRERAAVPPREATAVLFGSYGRPSAVERPADEAAGAGGAGDAPAGKAAVVPARTFFFFSGRFAYPFYDPYYYPYYPYYPYGYSYPYRYRAPTYTELTGDLLRLGLAEGRIEPRASVGGFLYFARGEGNLTSLRLRWSAPGLAAPLVAPVADGSRTRY